MRLDVAKSGASTTSSRPPWPLAHTAGTPLIGADFVPLAAMCSKRPGRSVTRKPPSGSRATDQGCSRPVAISVMRTSLPAFAETADAGALASTLVAASVEPFAGDWQAARDSASNNVCGSFVMSDSYVVWNSSSLGKRVSSALLIHINKVAGYPLSQV